MVNPITEFLFLGLKANYRLYQAKSQVVDFFDELAVLPSSGKSKPSSTSVCTRTTISNLTEVKTKSSGNATVRTDRRAARIERMKQNRAAAAAGRREGSPEILGTHAFLDLHTTPASLLPRELQEENPPISATEMEALEAQLDQLQEEVAQVQEQDCGGHYQSSPASGGSDSCPAVEQGNTQPVKVGVTSSAPIYSYLQEDFMSPNVATGEGAQVSEERELLTMTIPQYIQPSSGVICSVGCEKKTTSSSASSSTSSIPRAFGSALGANTTRSSPAAGSQRPSLVRESQMKITSPSIRSSVHRSAHDTENIAVALIERFGR